MEVEAEAVAYIVTQRFGLRGSSAEYVSRHLDDNDIPEGVSVDLIAKTAGLIERMARETIDIPSNATMNPIAIGYPSVGLRQALVTLPTSRPPLLKAA